MKSRFALILALALSCLSEPASAEVPQLAKIKAAAESGDAEAQFIFAKAFGNGSPEWKHWLQASADQHYGAAEDELAWALNWGNFAVSLPDPTMRASHLRMNDTSMRQALILAGAAAEKGFARSRVLLACAFARGYLLPQDRVEAYYWMMLSNGRDFSPNIVAAQLRQELLKVMSLEEVKAGERRAETERPVAIKQRIRTALILPGLRLTGLFSKGDRHIAAVNGISLTEGQDIRILVNGTPTMVHCLSVDTKRAVITLPPEEAQIILRVGAAASVLK